MALLRYDNRIPSLKGAYAERNTAEIVKCYVDASVRRNGIGSELVKAALALAARAGYEVLYLHTHRFLPGAVSFWRRQGFEIRLETGDELQTVHLDRYVQDKHP
ncbi:GNAT family N-acetyltransferase [Paenibacillus sp. P25]|nr:GNAT family N-acetyltransferase [Paenibacillus sp. P25]